MWGVGADAGGDQAVGEALLHDAGEGAGVRVAVAVEFVVEVGVGVEMEDGPALGSGEAVGADDGWVIEWSPPSEMTRMSASTSSRIVSSIWLNDGWSSGVPILPPSCQPGAVARSTPFSAHRFDEGLRSALRMCSGAAAVPRKNDEFSSDATPTTAMDPASSMDAL